MSEEDLLSKIAAGTTLDEEGSDCFPCDYQDTYDKGVADGRIALARELLKAREDAKPKPQPLPKHRSCNRHSDCDAAEQEVMARTGKKRSEISFSFHCHDDECEDCFGN